MDALNSKAAFSHVVNMPPTLLITGNGFTVTILVAAELPHTLVLV
jgi:hypothetical protein